MRNLLSVFLLLLVSLNSSARQRIILVTIDGLRSDVLTDSLQSVPFLHEMMQRGVFFPKVIGINPTMTYPSHTTIVTGVTPLEHGIHCNRQFQFNRNEPVLYNWYADSIHATTLWQIVKEHGGITASIFWPVTTGCKWIDYNLPEYFPTHRVNVSGMDYIRPVCTPRDIMAEIEREATGHLSDTTLRAGSFQYEAKVASMANYLTNRYHPDLMTVHLVTTDYKQHDTGTQSFATKEAFAAADHAIGLILENLQYTDQQDSVTLIVTGDHGFVDGKWKLSPNALLVQNGLLSEKPGEPWQACFNSLGAAAYMYVNPALSKRQQTKVIAKVISLLNSELDFLQQQSASHPSYRILTHDEIVSLKGDPTAALCLAPASGTGCTNSRTGAFCTPFHGGFHGYVYKDGEQSYDPTSLIIYAAGIKNDYSQFLQSPGVIRQTSISALIKHILYGE